MPSGASNRSKEYMQSRARKASTESGRRSERALAFECARDRKITRTAKYDVRLHQAPPSLPRLQSTLHIHLPHPTSTFKLKHQPPKATPSLICRACHSSSHFSVHIPQIMPFILLEITLNHGLHYVPALNDYVIHTAHSTLEDESNHKRRNQNLTLRPGHSLISVWSE